MQPVKKVFYILTAVLLQCHLSSSAQEATISEEITDFNTYAYSDPDPVARITKHYPYYRFDGFTNKAEKQGWKIVTLENPYIKVMVAPEIGGKVLGAIDKSSGEEFIYFNKVMKFRDIAMRGAWTSGGIEFNFGSIGHAPTTASPVNYLLKENSDGSVSCFVGAPDVTSRTEWRVEIRLQPDKSYFETRAIWYNPSDQNTSLYNWMTASVDATNDLEYYFPGRTEIGHGGEASSWPFDENNIDISHYKNNNFGGAKSYHVLGEYAEHFLCYFRDKEFGLGHWSPYDQKPGQKIWLWALSREGEIWADLLTDPGNIQYSEIQTGILFNQAGAKSSETPFKHLFLNAGTDYQFTELWFPVKKIGGMVKANEKGSLNVKRENGKVKIGFCANENLSGVFSVWADGSEIARKKIELKPTGTVIESFETDAEEISVEIEDVIFYSTNEKDERVLSRPVAIDENYDGNTTAAIFTSGIEMEKQRMYKGAEEQYNQVLRRNPFHAGALTKIAGLYLRSMQFEKAYQFGLKALSIDTYMPEANYVFGLACKKLNKKYDALDAFSMAAKSMEFRSLAYTQLSSVFFVDDQIEKCLYYANQALQYNQKNIGALKLKALALQRIGKEVERSTVLNSILSIDPLNAFAQFEKEGDLSLVLNYEMPQEISLELAIYYYNLDIKNKAVKALHKSPSHPITNYWLAFLLNDTGYLNKAITASPKLVYPFRQETFEVLDWAGSQNNNWKTKYYTGLVYWSKGRTDEARVHFKECENQPEYFAFYITRYHLMKDESDYNGEEDLLKAMELAPGEWRCYQELASFYEIHQEFGKALQWAMKGFLNSPENYYLAFQYAKYLLISGNYLESLKTLKNTIILPNEGARAGRITYRQACIMDAIEHYKSKNLKKMLRNISDARKWPENLGVGKPYDSDERIENYLESLYWHEKGDDQKARNLENSIIKYSQQASSFSSGHFLSAGVLKKAGREKEAREILVKWMETEPENQIAKWCFLKLQDNNQEAEKILKKIKKESGGTLFNPKFKDSSLALIEAISKIN